MVQRLVKKIVIFVLVFMLAAGQCVTPAYTKESYNTVTKEKNVNDYQAPDLTTGTDRRNSPEEADTGSSGEESGDTGEEAGQTQEEKTEESSGEDSGGQEENEADEDAPETPQDVQETDPPADEEDSRGQDRSDQTEEKEEEGEDKPGKKQTEEKKDSGGGLLRSTGSDVDHNVTMPDVTSHYFTQQKNGTNVSGAGGPDLKTVSDEKEAERFIFRDYPDGTKYNFSPSMSEETKISVHGGKGGVVSLDTVRASNYNTYGAVYSSATGGSAVSCAYNLEACSTAPYAIYTNVGSWYDEETGKTYAVDLKMTITGYLFPDSEIRKQLKNQSMEAPYVAFRNDIIGVDAMATDHLRMRLDFFYSGSEEPVKGIRGLIQFCDIDSQQGVDYGKGFEKVLLFDTGSSSIAYNDKGVMEGSVGYAYSEVNQNLNYANMNTTVAGLFSGSSVECAWTLSRCDQKDTGGSAKYACPGGYKIPRGSDENEAKSYYVQSSTGMMAIRADVGLAPLPAEVTKSLYQGEIRASSSRGSQVSLGLPDAKEEFTYVLHTNVAKPSNIRKARYTDFSMEDKVDALVDVESVRIYAGQSSGEDGVEKYEEVTDAFSIEKEIRKNGETLLAMTALEDTVNSPSFYGYSYYFHIHVRVRTSDELAKYGRDIREWYQEDDHLEKEINHAMKTRGAYCTANKGSLFVVNSSDLKTELTSNTVAAMLPRQYRVRKIDLDSGQPAGGVTFGLFAEDDGKPVMTAVSDEEGYAVFTESKEDRFYQPETGEGPYVIREISVPESLKNVWDMDYGLKLSEKIPSLKELLPKGMAEVQGKEGEFVNKNIESPPGRVTVIKKSSETGERLSGAVFDLMEWSDIKQDYVKLMSLEETTEADGKVIYVNGKEFKNTTDNLGSYKIVETAAPRGCYLSGQEWTFTLDQESGKDAEEITYEPAGSGKKQKGRLIYKNGMQKGQLTIHKSDDEGQDVPGAVFLVTAAEDIYAPWNIDDRGKPVDQAPVLVARGTRVDEIRTDDKGIGRSTKGCELYPGKYLVEETGGAKDHVKNSEPLEVEIRPGLTGDMQYIEYRLEVNNKIMHPSFAVAKLADKSTDKDGGKVGFDEGTGRYTEKKIPGIYQAGEKVRYRITVTNTGNTPLSHLVVTDDMSRQKEDQSVSLAQYVKEGSAGFKLPDDMILKSRAGRKIQAGWNESGKTSLILSELEPGDSVDLDYELTLSAVAADVTDLLNEVYVRAKYNDNEKAPDETHYVWVDTENMKDADGKSLAEDSDCIHVPGRPGLEVTKLADKTGGVEIKDGEISDGIRIPGIYREGEKLVYTIVVKNTETAALRDIHVEDQMSPELAAVVSTDHTGFLLEGQAEGGLYSLKTARGNQITAKMLSSDRLLLAGTKDQKDRLLPGDYVVLTYRTVILRDAANLYDLTNKAVVNGMYFDGNKDRVIPDEEDEDRISVPGEAEACVAKLADRTTGAVLKDGRYDGQAKITGSYKNSETVTYKITVTNRGRGSLYDMRLTDEMSQDLLLALDEETISFKEGDYTTDSGKTVRTKMESPRVLRLDFLAPGDSVDVYLSAEVKSDSGNLFDLENNVSLTARSRRGDEEDRAEKEEGEGKEFPVIYHANFGEDETCMDSETPCPAGRKVHLNGNPFDNPDGIFRGWCEDQSGTGRIYQPDDVLKMPDKPLDLYAVWIDLPDDKPLPYYRLIYDANDRSGRIAADAENEKPEDYVMKADRNSFVREGYRFDHWNDKPDDSGKKYREGDGVTMPDHDKKLYAIWEKIPRYSLIYYSNNGNGMERKDAGTPCEAGTVICVDGNAFSYQDGDKIFRFVEWNTRPDGSGDSFEPGSEMTLYSDRQLYAIWEETEDEPYHVIYHANDDTARICADAQSPSDPGEEIEIEENGFVRPGYAFAEWNTLADGSGTARKPGDSFEMPDRDVHLYAIWEKEAGSRLIYHSNNGKNQTRTDGESPQTQVEVDGIMFENAGKVFAGWNEKADGSGQKMSPGETIQLQGDKDLYAIWEKKVDTFKLIYSSNTEKEEKEYDSETPACEDTRVEINKNRFVREGFSFVEWNEKADGSGRSYQENTTFRMPAEDTVLYAVWKEEEKSEDPGPAGEDAEPGAQIGPSLPSAAEAVKKAVEQEYDRLQEEPLEEVFKEAGKYQELPETEQMSDTDHIHVPGSPDIVTAKLADRTRGVTLQNGRYKGSKAEGSYAPGEKVSYEIHVTNRGTADVYNVLVEDLIDKALLSSLKKKSIQITSGTIKSMKDDQIRVRESSSKKAVRAVILDHLKAGDSLTLHLTADLLGTVKSDTGLLNKVKISGEYKDGGDDGRPDLTAIPETDQMTDSDTISTGSPVLKIAKQADRTTGVKLRDGRLDGRRTYGTYKKGDMILYTLTLTNVGKAPAWQVKVEEKPTDRLKKYAKTLGFQVKKGDKIRTDSGAFARVVSASSTRIVLDQLSAGDQVKLLWKMQVNQDVGKADLLGNTASVDGKNRDGSEIRHTGFMDDREKINVEGSLAGDKGKGKDDHDHSLSYSSGGAKTGDHSMVEVFILLACAFGVCSMILAVRLFKRQEKKEG